MAERLSICEMLKVLDQHDFDTRHAGCGAVVGHKLYFWGGETSVLVPEELSDDSDDSADENEEENNKMRYESIMWVSKVKILPRLDDHPFDVFDLEDLAWSRQNTNGRWNDYDVPSVGIGSTLSYHKPTHSLYLFSGWNNRRFSSEVFCVSMHTWKWEKIVQPEGNIAPSPRYLTGVLIHEDKLCNFGGVGPDMGRDQDIGSDYRPYIYDNKVYDFGWNNQYYEFDVISKMWAAPISCKRDVNRPPPVGAHTFTKFDKHRALYFGGRRENGRTNVTYIFDLDEKKFDGPLELDISPIHRTFSVLCPLVDPEMVGTRLGPAIPPLEQNLILLWGKCTDDEIVEDSWLFNVKEKKWAPVELNEEGRYWHVACSYFPQPSQSSEGQVVIYGGAKQDPSTREISFVAQRGITILSFGISDDVDVDVVCKQAVVG